MYSVETLKGLVIGQLSPGIKISNWHSAILDEACENAINHKPELPIDNLILAAMIGFLTSIKTSDSVIRAGFLLDDKVTVNYRGQTFEFEKPPGE